MNYGLPTMFYTASLWGGQVNDKRRHATLAGICRGNNGQAIQQPEPGAATEKEENKNHHEQEGGK